MSRAAYRLAGNWTSALRAAGRDAREHREPKRWALERVAEWVRTAHAAGRDIRSSRAPAGALDRVAAQLGCTWIDFVESLGIPYPGRRKRRDWSDDAVLRAIRSRHRRGLPLNPESVVRDLGQGLGKQARMRFGSWEAAVRAAGIDPRGCGLLRRWSREIVVAAIRARSREGRSLRRADAYAEDPRLVKAAQRQFPSSWRRALEAAGLGAPTARGARTGRSRRRRIG